MTTNNPIVTLHPIVSPEALAEIYTHARREHPEECCGIIYGPKSSPVADRAVACTNIQNRLHAEDPVEFERDATTAYNLDARDLLKVDRSQRGDHPAKIIYHSHVNVGAYFSKTDQEKALFDGQPSYPVEYVVIDVNADGARCAVQFAWDAESAAFVEVARY
jgi:adenylyltransferase/sulfurtransferase